MSIINGPITEGCFVRLRSGSVVGPVAERADSSFQGEMGNIRTYVAKAPNLGGVVK